MLGDLAACAATLGALGHPARVLVRTGSTNDDARKWAGEGAPSGAVVIADSQTTGRGRHGRAWSSPPGATLAMSIVVRLAIAPARLPSLSIVAGLAVRAALARRTSTALGVKWPNDVVVRGDRGASLGPKLAGILVEASLVGGGVEHAVVGIGVNVARVDFPPELVGRATSLARLAPTRPAAALDRTAIAVEVVEAFDAELAAWLSDPDSIGARLEPHDVLRAARLRLEDGRRGHGAGVEPDGRLRVRLLDGSIVLALAGEVLVDAEPQPRAS